MLVEQRAFPGGWWHAHDLDSPLELMRDRLVALGIDPLIIPATDLARALEERYQEPDTPAQGIG